MSDREKLAAAAEARARRDVCSEEGACALHADHPEETAERCPGYCDADGCTSPWMVEVDGLSLCYAHGAEHCRQQAGI